MSEILLFLRFLFLHTKPKTCANLDTVDPWSVFTGPRKIPAWDKLPVVHWDKNHFGLALKKEMVSAGVMVQPLTMKTGELESQINRNDVHSMI